MPRKARRAAGIGLAALACLLFATEAEAFHNVCDAAPTVATVAPGKDVALIVEQRKASESQTEKLLAMSGLALKFLNKGIASSGGGSGTSLSFYNPGMGTFDSSTGWITADLKPGAQRAWHNPNRPDNSGDGRSYATGKKDLDAAITLWLSGSPSDQLMIAEGTTSTQTVNSWWTSFGGSSNQYPTAVLSYDATNSTSAADSSRYGRATGSRMPKVVLPTVASGKVPFVGASAYIGGTVSNYLVQGICLYNDLANPMVSVGFSGARSNVVFQNCRFQNVSFPVQADAGGATVGGHNFLLSRCAIYGTVGSGTVAYGGYVDWTDGFTAQDCIFYHNGWQIGAPRDGNTSFYTHDLYFHASNTNGRFDRCVHIDCGNDAANWRGDAPVNTQIVVWDAPIALSMGGFSVDPTADHRPGGVLTTVEDVAIIGGAHINSTNPRNWVAQWENTLSGSFIKNAVAFDSPYYTDASSCLVYDNTSPSLLSSMYLLFNNVRMWNYGKWLETGGGSKTKRHQTFQNCLVDSLGDDGAGANAQPNDAFTGTRLWTGTDYPLAVTRLQMCQNICSAMGLSTSGTYAQLKKRIVDVMLWRQDVLWAPMFIKQTLPKFGITPTYPTLDFPDMSAETPDSIFVYTA